MQCEHGYKYDKSSFYACFDFILEACNNAMYSSGNPLIIIHDSSAITRYPYTHLRAFKTILLIYSPND